MTSGSKFIKISLLQTLIALHVLTIYANHSLQDKIPITPLLTTCKTTREEVTVWQLQNSSWVTKIQGKLFVFPKPEEIKHYIEWKWYQEMPFFLTMGLTLRIYSAIRRLRT